MFAGPMSVRRTSALPDSADRVRDAIDARQAKQGKRVEFETAINVVLQDGLF